jgi:DNA-directed RNA polymerase sigma subunit (sigma70/sigma32)
MSSFLWPSEDGWPYPDGADDVASVDDAVDDDMVLLRASKPHLFDELDPLERRVVNSHYGLEGSPPRSMKELHHDLGMTRAEVRDTLAGGLAKLRAHLA